MGGVSTEEPRPLLMGGVCRAATALVKVPPDIDHEEGAGAGVNDGSVKNICVLA